MVSVRSAGSSVSKVSFSSPFWWLGRLHVSLRTQTMSVSLISETLERWVRCVHARIARSARRTGKRQIRGAISPRALGWPPRGIHLARLFNPSKIKPLYCFSLYLRVAKKYSHRRWEVQRPSNRMRNVPSHWTCAAWSESYSDRPQPSKGTDTRGQESTPWSGNWQFSGDSNQTKSIKVCFFHGRKSNEIKTVGWLL